MSSACLGWPKLDSLNGFFSAGMTDGARRALEVGLASLEGISQNKGKSVKLWRRCWDGTQDAQASTDSLWDLGESLHFSRAIIKGCLHSLVLEVPAQLVESAKFLLGKPFSFSTNLVMSLGKNIICPSESV